MYARIRPTAKADRGSYHVNGTDLDFRIDRSAQMVEDVLNNNKELFEFKFNGVFDQNATQDEVFDGIARQVVMNTMEGYNGTIFAYGQTGSGKTFTITGGPDKYEHRGLIPRSLDLLYKEIEARTDKQFVVRISYLEIYNGEGYDLLDPGHESKQLSDLPKVTLHMDESGGISMRNIGEVQCNGMDDALNLLFVGDTNRIICETPSNDVSTRSHCIFTINIESRDVGGSKIRRSKLHLVDLAGSERAKKTNINGQIFKEAKHINLSLHFLEQVIVALHQKSMGKRTHIPYRNSMMTSVLRDSLGGNCKTVMIATFNCDKDKIDESISTARFAQRVAQIKNDAVINEEQDPKLVIAQLKGIVKELKEEIAALKGERVEETELTQTDKERCQQLVKDFVLNTDPEGLLSLVNPAKIKECYSVFKQMIAEGNAPVVPGEPGDSSKPRSKPLLDVSGFQDEIKKLKMMVQARDNEINILVSMLKSGGNEKDIEQLRSRQQQSSSLESGSREVTVTDITDRSSAFEEFRKSYRKNQVIEENKQILKAKYEEAKQLGEAVKALQVRMGQLKNEIGQRRVKRGAAGIAEDGSENSEPDEVERQLMEEMNELRSRSKSMILKLKEQKSEILPLQHMLEKSRRRLQADFENWFSAQQKQSAGGSRSGEGSAGSSRRADPHRPPTGDRRREARPPSSGPERRPSSGRIRLPPSPGSHRHAQLRDRPDPYSNDMQNSTTTKTGNAQADADIAAFYKMRDNLLAKQQK